MIGGVRGGRQGSTCTDLSSASEKAPPQPCLISTANLPPPDPSFRPESSAWFSVGEAFTALGCPPQHTSLWLKSWEGPGRLRPHSLRPLKIDENVDWLVKKKRGGGAIAANDTLVRRLGSRAAAQAADSSIWEPHAGG